MANTILMVAGAIVLLSMVIAFLRFVLGPDYLNRVVAFDAMTIMSLSLIVMLSWFLQRMIYLDVALVYGLLSFLGVIAVARFGEGSFRMLEIIGALIALVGSVFLLLASLGLIRMPDVYNRMQAGTKATTLGSILIFVGMAFFVPAYWARLGILIVFIFLTNPLSSHALARSAHFQGIPVIIPEKAGENGIARDDLKRAQDALRDVDDVVQEGEKQK